MTPLHPDICAISPSTNTPTHIQLHSHRTGILFDLHSRAQLISGIKVMGEKTIQTPGVAAKPPRLLDIARSRSLPRGQVDVASTLPQSDTRWADDCGNRPRTAVDSGGPR